MSYYQPGTRSLSEVPGGNESRWDDLLFKLPSPQLGQPPILIRIAGGILTVGFHYIQWVSPKDGQKKYLFQLCPDFNIKSGSTVDGGCPLCRDFSTDDLPTHLKFKRKQRHFFHAFNVSAILQGQTEGVFGIVQANYFDHQELIAANSMYGKPIDHPQHGCTLKWMVMPSDNPQRKFVTKFATDAPTEIRWFEDKKSWAIRPNPSGPVVYGKEQELLRIIPKPNAADIEKKLRDLHLYEALAQFRGSVPMQQPSQPMQQPSQPMQQPQAVTPQQSTPTEWDDGSYQQPSEQSAQIATPAPQAPPAADAAELPLTNVATPQQATQAPTQPPMDDDWGAPPAPQVAPQSAPQSGASTDTDWTPPGQAPQQSAPAPVPQAAPQASDWGAPPDPNAFGSNPPVGDDDAW